jgi:hypothetical protein
MTEDHYLPEDRYVYMPVSDIMVSGGLCQHIKDSWWVVHPERGLVFFPYSRRNPRIQESMAQCSTNEIIARRYCPPFAEIRFFASVLQPVHVTEER